jgi:DNA-binding MurR/RpiR family transcriptional regulator
MRAMQVAAMGPGDTLLAMTFDDYTPETVEVVRLAAARGHRVLAITDNALSPVAGWRPMSFTSTRRGLGISAARCRRWWWRRR